MKKKFSISIYTSRNCSRTHPLGFDTLKAARAEATRLCRECLYSGEDFHGNPMQRSKVAIEWGEYPKSYELWEFSPVVNSKPVKYEWSN